MLGTISGALARSLIYLYTYIYLYISRKTLRSLRPEIGEFAGRAGEDREVEDRAGEDMAGQGRAGGHIKSGKSKSRAGRGQKAGQGMMGIVQYEKANVQGRAKTQSKEKRAKIKFLVSGNFEM